MKNTSSWLWVFILMFSLILLFQAGQGTNQTKQTPVAYSKFKEMVAAGMVKEDFKQSAMIRQRLRDLATMEDRAERL